MSSGEEVDTLKVYWDHFFKAETGTYEKSTWLDLFLAEFLIRVNEGANPKELIHFCPVSGVVTLVGCELLCGIHRVTSSINSHYSVSMACLDTSGSFGNNTTNAENGGNVEAKTDDAKTQSSSLFTRINAQSSEEILKKYLLGGVAWRCLMLLQALGVEGLSCCRQLSSVLIWLFGELSTVNPSQQVQSSRVPSPCAHLPPTRLPIYQLFSHKIWSKHTPSTAIVSKVNSAATSDRGSVTGRSRRPSQNKLDVENKPKRKTIKHSDSSESGDTNDDLQILNRSLTIKVTAPNDDFEYFNSSIRSSNDYPNESVYDPFYSPKKIKPKAENHMTEKHKAIINSEITTFEFILLITNLLQELCKAESSLSGAEGSQISMQCINFSLRNLCSLQFSSLPQANESSVDGAKIKVALTELLIVSLDKVLVHSDLCAKLINNGILPMLLRILEDVISKCKNRAKDIELMESRDLLKFVFGIAYSITAFFHCLLMQCRTVDKLREFTDQFKLYGDCLKGGLLVECIELMIRLPGENREEIAILLKKLIESIGKLICGMKRVRSEVIHSAACPRTRHKVCRQRVAAGMHHHHDIMGEASTGLPMSSTCCISVLYGTLTSLLTDDEVTAESMLRNKILRVMLNCGVCCCFSPGFLMESIVRLMLTHNNVAPLCLQLLEHTVYGDLGASVLVPKVTDQLPCSICEPCDEKKEFRKYCPHGVSAVERKSVCSFLIHYNSLLQLDNHNNLLHATVSHLLRVTPKCRMEMKYELLFSVIYPTFIVSKHRYIIRLEETAYFLTVSCLNIFASLLNTVSFAEQFIQKGGLSYVLELVSLSEFSSQCCSILEIAIIVEIFKLMKENSELTYFREISSLSSVQMLFKSLTDVTEKFHKIYKLKLPAEKYEELCDLSGEKEFLGIPEVEAKKMSLPQQIKTTFGSNEDSDCPNDYSKTLKNVWNFWKTCASLCLYSPMFREYMVSENVFLDSYSLLKISLYYLCNCEYGAIEMRILIKMVEALLTMQFSVSDVTQARSKDTSCKLVREALSSAGAVFEGGGGLRALCEALIRVATAHPSRHHSMPRVAHGKVPPLVCPPGGSSAEGSSSEESVSAPYASEHSDPTPTTPDEGYEADVEVSKLDIPLSYRVRKMSESMASVTHTSGIQSPSDELMGSECAEYTKSGELAHPELCIIVVDILTQLISKLLKSKSSVEGNGDGECEGIEEESVSAMKRVGGQLARACCARLAGAVGRGSAGAAPPLLLHRLLARAAAAPDLLARRDLHLEDLQRSILELIHVLASQSISASELGAFLKLFTSERPPLKMLLTSLQRLVTAASCNTPDCILTFPVDIDNREGIETLSEELSHLVVNSATSQSHLAESYARKLQDAHMRAGIKSPWSCGAVRCGIEGAGWAPWLQGFALVLWLHAQPHATPHHRNEHNWEDKDEFQNDSSDAESKKKKVPPRKESPSEPSHVMSVGHESLMFELWLDTATGVFTLRLSRPEASCNRVVSEARVASAMPPRAWNCIALNLTETVHKRHIFIQVTLFVNGYECDTVSLPVQGILVRKVTPTSVVVGHAGRRPPAGVYHLSHATVYRAPLLTACTALHLTAHGPDNACLVRCESPNYPLILTPNVLDSNIDWDQVYEISTSTLRDLHDNLLLTFGAHAPNIMNLYHQTVALPTVFAGRVPGGGGLMSMPAVGPPPPPAAGAPIPETLFPTWRGSPLPSRHRGLAPALYLLGGPDMLLFLYARVVELKGTAEEQALALGVLLRACRVDNRLYAMLHSEDTLDMLLTVFAAPDCKATHHLLEVVINEACSAPIVASCGDSVVVGGRGDAVLLEPALLVLLTRAWRHLDTKEIRWEVDVGGGGGSGGKRVERGCCWALFLRCVGELLGHTHPRRAFNHYQMTRVDLLTHLLLACKERFLNSECGPLDQSTSSTLVEVVRGLMGTPPLLHRVALLCDFLLLMHQASDTFVTHSRANFYFLLTSETQEMSEFASSSKRKPSKRSKRKPELDIPSVSSTSTEDNEGLNLKDMGHKEEDRMDSSIESTKQLKGLINMQIKEGRKHHMSSTSENSDTTAEHCLEEMEGEEGRLKMEADVPPSDACMQPDDLTEYIVVDVEDVNHTTVEMYTGGIYHQRRVRAGALPGWCACEGLLLLLRDAVAVLPEYALKQAVCGPISAETLIVLGNHKQACVRAALVRVVAALQRRAPPDLARKLRHHHYYIHLANQISLYDGSWELATACAALLTKCDVPLEDQLDDDIWVDMSEESIQRSPPVLALLPACLRDVPLAHNITLIVRRIIDKASLKMLNEVSVAEVVVRCVRAMGQMADVSFEGRELLIEDLHELLNRIALKALAQHHTMQSVCELHYMLSYVEMTAEEGGARRAARDAQVALYVAQLDYLEERLHTTFTASTRYANYFTTVLSSAVSLGGESASRLERSEVSSRHLATATRALHFLTSLPPTEPLGADALLMDRLLSTLLTAVGGSGGERARWWAGVGSGAEWVAPLQELVWWAAAPTPSVRPAQPHLLRALYHAPPTVVHMLTPPDPSAQRKLAVYVLSMIGRIHADAECGPAPVELAITDWARGWALASQAALPDRLDAHALPAEAQRHAHADYTRRLAHAATQRPHIAKVVFGKEALSAKVTETAMGVTRGVVEAQNGERKAFMEHLRREHAMHSHNAARWQRLIDAHTHQQAVWHDPDSYPVSWQLDATEGPGRVRVRMRRAHLHIAPRFLKPNERYKTELCKRPPPLRSVVGGRLGRGARGGLVARLQLNETVSYMARVICVTVARETGGELLLTDRCIHFVPEEAEESEGGEWCEGSEEGREAQSWPLEEVQQVATRRWCLQERALEMFLGCGRAILLAFATQQERGAFLKALDDAHLPATIEPDSLHEAMSQWRSGSITNWEYLMRLNGLAGRSYNDLMQYPVLPFVIADYTSRILDLTDPKSFRDLSKPMAVQNKNREQHYINVYHDLKAARREGCSPLLSRQPHHYASLYSNSGGVLHYLVRVPPFTTQFLNYQDNNFDMPDRTFHSLATTWRLITNDSPTDVKELIPELFYLPELFHNSEGLNLGVRQCGLGVDSVELPPWAADARLFTLVHRQALEAPLVTDALPHWIDLVFGYKQTGQPAIDAINVFPACTYYGFDPLALEDEVDRTAAAAMVRTYGQVPRQLLRTPHPQRQPDLVLHHRDQEVVWDGVVGASWGRYCGSPALPAPEVAAKRACAGAAALHALPNPRAVAVANRATALMVLHGEPTTNSQGKEGQRSGLALVSWGHSDGIVRLKRRRDARPDLLLHIPPLDQITKVTSSCSSGGCPFPLLVGFASGRVLGVRARALPGAPPRVRTRQLHAHRHPITDMYLCPRAGLLATTSSDGLIVLWDLNTLSYIRTLPNRDMIPVTHVTISATLCDVATVHDATAPPSAQSTPPSDADAYEKDAMYKYKSLIRVHTVNASFVGSVRVSEAVTCIVYSGAAEGVSANCVGAGLATGGVRLYSAWDLRALAHIPPPHPHPHATPLLSLCYGSDSQVLYGCYADGVVVAWEAAGRGRGAPPRIHPAHALL